MKVYKKSLPQQTETIMDNKNVLVINMINGSTAYTTVPENYEGPCKVTFHDQGEQDCLAVMPNLRQAEMLATFLVSPDLGLQESVIERSDEPVTHQTFKEWAISFEYLNFEAGLSRGTMLTD